MNYRKWYIQLLHNKVEPHFSYEFNRIQYFLAFKRPDKNSDSQPTEPIKRTYKILLVLLAQLLYLC